MKDYIEHPDGRLVFEGMTIPTSIANRHYREFLELEKAGEARRVSAPPIDPWNEVRGTRNSLLSSSDWTQLSDNKLSKNQKAQWRSYRNQVRNVVSNFNSPEKVVWPVPPVS